MKITLLLLGLCGAAGTTFLSDPARTSRIGEPPLRAVLVLDGQRHECEIDRPFELEIGETKLSAVVELAPTRRFVIEGLVNFDYPRDMSYEEDLGDPDLPIWTMDGNSATLIVERLVGVSSVEDALDGFAKGVRETFEDAEVATAETDFAGARRPTRILSITISEVVLRQEVIPVPIGDDILMVVFQDILVEDSSASAEWEELRRIVSGTLRIGG